MEFKADKGFRWLMLEAGFGPGLGGSHVPSQATKPERHHRPVCAQGALEPGAEPTHWGLEPEALEPRSTKSSRHSEKPGQLSAALATARRSSEHPEQPK